LQLRQSLFVALLDMSGLRSTRTEVTGKLPSHFRAVRSGGKTDLFRPIRLLKRTFSLTKPPKSAYVISETLIRALPLIWIKTN
jgi:hypothetical protein